jgi:hypothetical protein
VKPEPSESTRPDTRPLRATTVEPTAEPTTASWQDIKCRFVDDPAGALAAAEALVQATLDDRIRALREEVAALGDGDGDGDGDGEASSTETLRTRLIRYQAYCERLAARTAH